jgi:hypothetical protein
MSRQAQNDDLAELAQLLPAAPLSIEQALKLREFAGKPISALYEKKQHAAFCPFTR